MTEYQKLVLEYARILGEFKGVLQAVTHWDVPDELKNNMNNKIKELENIKTPDINIEKVKSSLGDVSDMFTAQNMHDAYNEGLTTDHEKDFGLDLNNYR